MKYPLVLVYYIFNLGLDLYLDGTWLKVGGISLYTRCVLSGVGMNVVVVLGVFLGYCFRWSFGLYSVVF